MLLGTLAARPGTRVRGGRHRVCAETVERQRHGSEAGHSPGCPWTWGAGTGSGDGGTGAGRQAGRVETQRYGGTENQGCSRGEDTGVQRHRGTETQRCTETKLQIPEVWGQRQRCRGIEEEEFRDRTGVQGVETE